MHQGNVANPADAELYPKIEVTRGFLDNAVRAHSRGELTAVDAATEVSRLQSTQAARAD